MSYSKEQKKAVICHELGHWLIAQSLGYKVAEIKIKFNRVAQYCSHDAHANILPQPDFMDINDIYKYIDDRIVILCSGLISENFSELSKEIIKKDAQTLFSKTASDDYKKIIELLLIARGIKFSGNISEDSEGMQRNEIFQTCWGRAMNLVGENHENISKASEYIAIKAEKDNFCYRFYQKDLSQILSPD